MTAIFDTSNWPSVFALEQRNAAGEKLDAIAKSLGASRATLKRYLAGKSPKSKAPEQRAEELVDTIVASDNAFIEKMTAAIRLGQERAEFGIKVDHTPPINHVVIRAFFGTGFGSPAAMCMAACGAEAEATA